MNRRDRLRRVILLGCSFGRNLAFYRVGREPAFAALLDPSHPHGSFWRQANSNFLEVSVLEWCKLMGDKKAPHVWHKIVEDSATFNAELLTRLQMTNDNFADYVREIRDYRDKFVAHLDSDLVMQIPLMSVAKEAIWFYCEHVITSAITKEDLVGLPDTIEQMEDGYMKCMKEAKEVFSRDLVPGCQ